MVKDGKNDKVAIKTLKHQEEKNEEAVAKEIKNLLNMENENIVKFIGWTSWNNKKGIVMECMHTSLHAGKMILNVSRFILYFIKLLFYSDRGYNI